MLSEFAASIISKFCFADFFPGRRLSPTNAGRMMIRCVNWHCALQKRKQTMQTYFMLCEIIVTFVQINLKINLRPPAWYRLSEFRSIISKYWTISFHIKHRLFFMRNLISNTVHLPLRKLCAFRYIVWRSNIVLSRKTNFIISGAGGGGDPENRIPQGETGSASQLLPARLVASQFCRFFELRQLTEKSRRLLQKLNIRLCTENYFTVGSWLIFVHVVL